MAYTFNIENTWGTVSLNSNPTLTPGIPGCTVIDYPAKSAPVQDGTETVDEQFRILVQGTTQAEVNAIVGTIQRAFRTAEKYQEDGSGPRTFFARSLGTMTATYRSEIVAADFGVSSFEYVGTGIYAGGFGYKTELSGRLTRRNWWEGAESQLPLTNPNGTANITGLRVYSDNCGTGSGTALHYNWFDVPGTAIAGDLPAAYRIEYNFGTVSMAPKFTTNIAISKTQLGTAYDSIHWLEAIASGTATAAASRTNGTVYIRGGSATWNLSGTGGWGVPTFTAYTATYEGQSDYRIYACMTSDTVPITIQTLGSLMQTNAPAYNDLVQNVYALYDFGVIQRNYSQSFPLPEQAGQPTAVVNKLGNSGTVIVDFMTFMRSNYYRELNVTGYQTVQYTVIDDMLETNNVYNKGTNGYYETKFTAVGNPKLEPENWSRVYTLLESQSDYLLYPFDVKLYYRPRYLSL